ncbi:MAG: signal peptide peptidase SppA [Bacteroidales bacterium]|nr:MAG: signal peptide peptidase SppA [Bacteroidales bacterium]
MKSFLKYTLATIVGVILSSFILFLISFGLIGAMIAAGDKPAVIQPNSVLLLNTDQNIPDRGSAYPWGDFNPVTMKLSPKTGLDEILENIEKAKSDENITGIYIETGMTTPGISTIEEIRNALIDFRESGKFILCYSDDFLTQSSYYLGTVADSIFLNPAGILQFFGLRSEITFYKNALDKLGVEMQIIRQGKFKSAVEPYMLDKMSKESREQILGFLNPIWEHLLAGISTERDIPVEKLDELADNLAINLPESAVENRLIDGLKYKDEILDELKKLSGISAGKKVRLVSMNQYSKVPVKRKYKGLAKNKIAIVYATGIITFGEGGEYSIGSAKFSKAIRKAREDSLIKAIVLRINSPGGIAMAADIIWREVDLASKVKPVIASMGNVAASGGYYIAAPADTILAHPTTLTGSIGAFGTIPNAQKLLNDKLGITFDVAKTNDHADFGSIYRPLNQAEKEYLQIGLDRTYDDFLSHVAEGRNLTKEKVDSIGQGRVWSGADAKENGLVDVFGGINRAIAIAAEMTDLDHYRIVSLPVQEDPYQKLLKDLSGNIKASIIKKELGESYRYYRELNDVIQYSGIQMRMPFFIEIH